jgi:hypothetical protein
MIVKTQTNLKIRLKFSFKLKNYKSFKFDIGSEFDGSLSIHGFCATISFMLFLNLQLMILMFQYYHFEFLVEYFQLIL